MGSTGERACGEDYYFAQLTRYAATFLMRTTIWSRIGHRITMAEWYKSAMRAKHHLFREGIVFHQPQNENNGTPQTACLLFPARILLTTFDSIR